MQYHILNGDGLAHNFDLEGEIIICREALIEGDLTAENSDDFWKVRADFIGNAYGANDYFEKVKSEFDKLNNLKSTDEVNFWFGNEAFCQVNLWFVLWLISDKEAKFYRVFPDSNDWNCSFENLSECFESRQKLTKGDVNMGKKLWKSFCFRDFDSLKNLSETSSSNFKNLKEVCQALIEKDTKPEKVLREITNKNETDFSKIFRQFKEKAGVYGFGDLQVRNILEKI